MCGLFGMINKMKSCNFNQNEANHFFDMSIMTSLRGRDSSSVWGIDKSRLTADPRMWKTLGDPFYLINSKAGEAIEKFMLGGAKAMFGHGRRATLGKVSVANAHPFIHKNITLMHNGTIHGGLDQKTEIEVDSHALAILVQEKGVKAALEQVDGAFAIVAYDSNRKKILIARNWQRPLHYVEGTDIIFIMSDRKPLDYVMERMGRTSAVVKDFEAMKVYEIDPEDPHLESTQPIATKTYNNSYFNWNNHDNSSIVDTKQIPFKRKSFDDSTWAVKRGQMVRFHIEDSVKQDSGNRYKFWGVDTDGNEITFFDSEPHPEWVDRLAQATVMAAWPEREGTEQKLVYIVSPKDLSWLPTWDDLTENERITIIKECKCSICDQLFIEDDINSLVIHKRNPLEVVHGECEYAVEAQIALVAANNISV